MMALLTDADIGLGGGDALVQAPNPSMTSALQADMARQSGPVVAWGKDTYKDSSGAVRYGTGKPANGGLLSDADIGLTQGKPDFGAMPSWSTGENLNQAARDVGGRVKDLAKGTLQTGGVLADMILGSPGALWKASVYAGARATGVSGAEAEEYSNRLSPEGILAPVQSTIKALGLGEGTDEQAISKAMSIIGDGIKNGASWLSKKTNGAVPPEDFEEVTNALMGIAGIKGGQAMVNKVIANTEKARLANTPTEKPTPGRVEPRTSLEITIIGGREEPTIVPALPSRGNRPAMVAYAKENNLTLTEAYKQVTELKKVAEEKTATPDEGVSQIGTTGDPIVEAGFRARPGGEYWESGTKHDADMKMVPGLEPVFKTAGGQILSREEALVHARTTGQLDPKAKIAPEGLHSGDIFPEGKSKLLPGVTAGAAAVAAGGWLYMNPEDADKIGMGGLMAAGAIKGKGGMWHPEAVTRLADPLISNVMRSNVDHNAIRRKPEIYNEDAIRNADTIDPIVKQNLLKDIQVLAWSDKTVRNWLNKHAGTPTDPLKGVRVPMMGDDVRWEDLTDNLIESEQVQGPKGLEDQWHINTNAGANRLSAEYNQWLKKEDLPMLSMDELRYTEFITQEQKSVLADFEGRWDELVAKGDPLHTITSYISHVGDYLREFVPVDKLQQYDLVRAVKETAKQDEIQAAKMAKARVNQAGTVTFKEYPDGMKWVEVGRVDPGLVTPEGLQKAGYTMKEIPDKLAKRWAIYDPEGKFLQVSIKSPAEAWRIAAEVGGKRISEQALKNEGDVMGHCVGGYCEYVHSGESKIYSLRDKQGMSHVTVEIEPPKAPTFHRDDPTLKMGLGHEQPNILQIKGKQNRAPVDKYIPYVQDFVKSGNWGQVGDLENAGLVHHKGQYFTHDEMRAKVDAYKAKDSPQGGQRGSVDPKLLGKIAAVGVGAALGAYIDSDNRLIGATLGGLAGLGTGVLKKAGPVKALEKGLKASIDQFVRKVNPDAMGPKAEQSTAILASHYVKQLQAQVFQGKEGADRQRYFNSLPEKDQVAFTKALEIPGVKYEDSKLQGLRDAYKGWMNRVYEQDQANGIKYDPLDNYVYHIFTDPDAVTEFFQQRYGTKWGDPKFTKERSAKLISEAEAAGFKLKYTNPEQIAQARQLASDIAQMKVNALRDVTANGLARKVEKGMKATPSETLWRSPNGELYFLSDEANQVFHNAFNSKSLWNDAGVLGMTYRGAMWTKNAVLPVKLLSLFHPLHIALGMNLGTTAVNAIKGVASGKISVLRAGVEIGKSALLIDSAKQLRYIARDMQPHSMRAFRGDIPPDKITALDNQQMQNAYDGGFSPEMAEEYRNQSIKDFKNAVTRHSATAIWQAPFALMEAAWTRPMFQNWIPAVKWEAFQKSAAAHMEANPHLAGDVLARRVELHKVAKMIDDRFGEVQYKTLFMDRLVKDTAVASFLSYGWQLGFVRSYLGAVPEAWRAFTKNEGPGAGTLREKIAQGKLDKTLFLGNYLTSTMLYGGLFTYALTGEAPRELLDYIYPRSGDKNKDGTDARVSTPFYTREFVQIPEHVAKSGVVGGLATTVSGKLSPVFSMMRGIVMNKDYFDHAIANPNDDLLITSQKKGKWLLGEMAPMAMNRSKNAPDTDKSKILGAAGFNPAPKYITHPQPEEFITIPKRKKKTQ